MPPLRRPHRTGTAGGAPGGDDLHRLRELRESTGDLEVVAAAPGPGRAAPSPGAVVQCAGVRTPRSLGHDVGPRPAARTAPRAISSSPPSTSPSRSRFRPGPVLTSVIQSAHEDRTYRSHP